jgi:hypothetical protein
MTAADAALRRGLTTWARYRVILYFLLGLVAVDVFVISKHPVWSAYDPDDYTERLDGCRREAPELVLVGGSPVCEGIDPNVLIGLPWQGRPLEHVYNLGLPGATTSEVWHAIEHGLAVPPRLLIYGITASDINDGRDEPHGPRSLMDVGDTLRWVRYRPRAAEWGIRQFLQGQLNRVWQLFYYRNGIRLCASDYLEHLLPGACTEAAAEARDGLRYTMSIRTNHGYAPRPEFQARSHEQRKADNLNEKRFAFLEKFRLGGHLAYLHRLVDWASSHDVTLLLVDMPVTADLEERMHPQEFASYRAVLAQLERDRGVRVVRARRADLGLSDADFADLIHLNVRGSTRFSSWLREELTRQYPNDSEDPSRDRQGALLPAPVRSRFGGKTPG